MTVCAPATVHELQALVHDSERIHAFGKGSKTALHSCLNGAALADLSALSGIIEYQPSEYTVTVRAGTPVRDLSAALRERGQYLPCDPLLPDAATLGGTVAGNLSGSRRYRYGGLRDFILGAEVVDGMGRAFRVGGKVVKNSAGFDLSKFLVGSLGAYAIMTELTFKVFPDVPRFHSLAVDYASLEDALAAIYFINQNIFELDALDLIPLAGRWRLLTRLAGFDETLPRRVERFSAAMTHHTSLLHITGLDESATLWDPLADLTGAYLVKVALSPKQVPAFDHAITAAQRRYGVGANVAWVADEDLSQLVDALKACSLTGLCLRGDVESAVIGAPLENVLAARVKQVLDPLGKLV